MQQQKCQKCGQLLQEFIKYKEQSLGEKEAMRREVEKCRQMLEKFSSKVDRRVDNRIREERNVNHHRIQEVQELHRVELSKLDGLLVQKDRVIEEMRYLLRGLEVQKRELIQNNTKVLVQLSQGIENKGQKGSEVMDQSYKELLKMYQYLMDENNQLKKEVYGLRRQGAMGFPAKNQSFLSKQDKSLNNSEYRINNKSITDISKGQIIITTKTQPSKDKPKEKGKRPPTAKHTKK